MLRSSPAFLFIYSALALMPISLSSCSKKPVVVPPLDRDSLMEETSWKLPKETEVLHSRVDQQSDEFTYSTIILRMPKAAEKEIGYVVAAQFTPNDTIYRLDANNIAQLANYQLKDKTSPCRSYNVKSKTRGDGSANVYSDGDNVVVFCNFKTPTVFQK
jgi:hypothetical protein